MLRADPLGERSLLWYMGGAAVGMPDDVALGEVVLRLETLSTSSGDPVAKPYADLLRGARLIGPYPVEGVHGFLENPPNGGFHAQIKIHRKSDCRNPA